jgi:hypothetical protein
MMSKMSELSYDIETMLAAGTHPVKIARALGVELPTVYDVLEQLECLDEEQALADMPQDGPLSDAELNKMAEYYGYKKEEYCEFDR